VGWDSTVFDRRCFRDLDRGPDASPDLVQSLGGAFSLLGCVGGSGDELRLRNHCTRVGGGAVGRGALVAARISENVQPAVMVGVPCLARWC